MRRSLARSFDCAAVLGRVQDDANGVAGSAEPPPVASQSWTRPARGGCGALPSRAVRERRENEHDAQDLRAVVGGIERHDPDLARLLRRAASSVTLNVAEGSSSQGRNRKARYYNALGSAKELRACLDVAVAAGYLEVLDDALVDENERVIATLIRLVI